MAYAGLRPNEVRALLGRDIRWEGKNAQRRGTILVREGLSAGELGDPKTGQRKVPILGPLVEELRTPPSANAHVATTAAGEPWGEWSPNQAFKRLCGRLKLPEAYTIYSLRHWAITSWLRAGIPVHVVQRMAGHKHLSTTQRYVHFVDADLDAATTIWGSYGATAAE
jgi:integrase